MQWRYLYYFTGSSYSSSLLSWDGVDIDRTNYRSIAPRTRTYGLGSYNMDTMLNLSAFRGSNGLINSGFGSHLANGGTGSSSSALQVSALETRPSIFWNAQRRDYASVSSAGAFTNQNSNHFFSVWRSSDGSDVIADFASGNNGSLILLNINTDCDDQLFVINGQGKGNTPNGSPFSKVVLSANYTDFSTSRPLLMSLVGGLSKTGGDILNKNEPGDAYWRAGNFDYYLNYYPKYDGTSKKLLAKDDGSDWIGLESRAQIDGTQAPSTISASALSHVGGYSKVCKIAYT